MPVTYQQLEQWYYETLAQLEDTKAQNVKMMDVLCKVVEISNCANHEDPDAADAAFVAILDLARGIIQEIEGEKS